MKKILLFSALCLALLFVACNLAKDSVKLAPDIQVTGIDPIGAYVVPGGGTTEIKSVYLVPMNSIDAYMKGFVFTYYDVNNNVIYGPSEIYTIFAKIDGIVRPDSVDTTVVENLQIPTDTVANYLLNTNLTSAKAQLDFVFTDQYEMNKLDTATVWFGLYRLP